MISIANQKRFIGLTVSCLATIVPLSMLGNRIALGQTATQQSDLLTAALSQHNVKRAIHGSPALTAASATDSLTTGSQDWAKHLADIGSLVHSNSQGVYGENLSVSYTTDSPSPTSVGTKAVDDWYSEINNYDFTKPKFDAATGHFTQVVWVGTTTLGCGYAIGTATINAMYSDGTIKPTLFNAYYTVCRYSPAGNVEGQFATNVFPPMVGKPGG